MNAKPHQPSGYHSSDLTGEVFKVVNGQNAKVSGRSAQRSRETTSQTRARVSSQIRLTRKCLLHLRDFISST
jgi:hypothetical protein